MEIAIIGTGSVGSALGTRWGAGGHEVIYATRDPGGEKVRRLVATTGAGARAAEAPEAVADADIVVLAAPWSAAEAVLGAAGDLRGKVLVDATNPVAADLAGLAIGHTTSAAEHIARWAAGALVVKAFNCTGANVMANPVFGGHAATMFICGDDDGAKRIVAGLAQELGFDVIDAGTLVAARYLEPLAMLWIHLAYAAGHGREIAFRLLSR